MNENNFMRMIVMFDLPVSSKEKMKAANKFRVFLKKDGYQMLQLSIYSRIVKGRDGILKHQQRLRCNIPREGYIRCLIITEKQYASMEILLGDMSPIEKKVNSQQLLLF